MLAVLTPTVPPPARAPELSPMEKLVQLLLSETAPPTPAPAEPPGLKTLLQTYFAEQQSPRQGLRFRQVRRNWSDVKCFSCGKTGHGATRCPTLDVTFPFILPGVEGQEDFDWLLDDIAKVGGKRRLIRREGFASWISKNARPHDPGGGGTIGYPAPQNAKMNLRKSAMDMNTNRNAKLMLLPWWPKGPAPTVLQLNSANQHIGKARRRPSLKRIRTLLINRNRPNIRGRLWWPRRLEPTVLRMYSVGRSIMIIRRRQL